MWFFAVAIHPVQVGTVSQRDLRSASQIADDAIHASQQLDDIRVEACVNASQVHTICAWLRISETVKCIDSAWGRSTLPGIIKVPGGEPCHIDELE